MNLFKRVLTFVILIQYLTIAQEPADKTQPQLSVQQSNYVEFKSTNITASNGTITFDGKFIVLGDAIFGHFDVVANNDSGKIIQKTMSEDRAWKRDHGGNLKSITVSMRASNAAKVVVSFHEMRINPNSGACKK
jgi:putative lipoic acid-binding regulatory protein